MKAAIQTTLVVGAIGIAWGAVSRIGSLPADDLEVSSTTSVSTTPAPTDEEARTDVIVAESEQLRAADPLGADRLLLGRYVAGFERALTVYGSAQPINPHDGRMRREALLEGERLGDGDAGQALDANYREAFLGQALSKPKVIVALAEGSPERVPDTTMDRRYLIALADGAITACPFERGVFGTAGFKAARDAYEAPLRAKAQARLLASTTPAAKTFVKGIGEFIAALPDEGYEVAGARLLRTVARAEQTLNQAGSTASADGARDGARVPTVLNGCGQADMLRIARTLQDIFRQRSAFEPGGAPTTVAVSPPLGPGLVEGLDEEAKVALLRSELARRADQAERGGAVDRSTPLILSHVDHNP